LKARATLFALLFFWFSQSGAQEYYYEHYTEKEGLNSSTIYKVIQDQKGYLWFATASGLNRFDGAVFEEFTTHDGLTDNDVISLFEDSQGRVWFETFNGRPSFYQDGQFYNAANNELLAPINPNKFIKRIHEDSQGNIWLSYFKYSYKIDFEEGLVTFYNERSLFFEENEKGEMLLYSGYDYYYNTATKQRVGIPKYYRDEVANGRSDYCVLKNGDVLFSKEDQLYLKHRGQLHFDQVDLQLGVVNFTIIDIHEDQNGEVFLATDKGVYSFEHNDFGRVKTILKNKSATSVLSDYQENLWITTFEGVFKINAGEVMRIANSYSDIASFDSSVDQLLVASGNRQLSLLELPSLRPIKNLISDQKPRKVIGYEGLFYVLANIGVRKVSKGQAPELFERSSCKDLVIDQEDIVLAKSMGVSVLANGATEMVSANGTQKDKQNFLPDARVFSLLNTEETVLVATNRGVYKSLEVGGSKQFVPILSGNSAYKNRIVTMAAKDEQLFFGTDINGLYVFGKDSLEYHFSEENGLLSNQVRNLFFYEGNLAITTKNGVQFLRDGELVEVEAISHKKFVLNEAKAIGDTLFLATSEGLLYYNLKREPKEAFALHSEIVAYENGDPIPNSAKIAYQRRLPLTFDFKVFDFSENKKTYEYQLAGFENKWNTTTSRTVNYQNIGPGRYQFILKYNGQIINRFAFNIKPPIWYHWWFYMLLAGVVITVFIALNRYFLRKKMAESEKETAIQLKIAKIEQDALRAQMNPHFIFNALNAIQNLILKGETDTAHQYLGDFSKLVRSVLNQSRTLNTTIAEEVKFLNLYLKLESLRFSGRFKYTLSDKVDKSLTIPSMIVQPLVENAVIHGLLPKSKAKANELHITFSENEDFIYCEVDDNGIGLLQAKEKSDAKKSWGLNLVHDRLGLFDGSGLSKLDLIKKKTGTTAKLTIRKNVQDSNR
jgi:hypothetical protein